MPDSPGDDGDRVAAAVAELYAGDPESFVSRRTQLAADARAAGDRTAATAIGALRRPTRTAWVVNTLARSAPAAPEQLTGLATALRDAQAAKDGRRLRELSAERGELIDALTQQALDAAGVTDAPPAVRLEVSQTLTAALADPGTAADFAAGRLTRAVQWSGFGVLPADGDTDSGSGSGEDDSVVAPVTRSRPARAKAAAEPAAPDTSRVTPDTSRVTPASGGRGRLKTVPDGPDAAKGTAKAGRGQLAGATQRKTDAAPREAERRAAEAERRAEEARRQAEEAAAERAAQRREQYAEAQHAATVAATAAAEAGAAEDRLESEVRQLEERLTDARSELAAARQRARRAESAEHRARQALDRLPRE